MELKRKTISIITPVYNEEQGLEHYYQRVTEVILSNKEFDFEVLFIDDGSVDNSWKIILEICNRASGFRGIKLSRNFGSHTAIACGFDHCSGDAAVVFASDLQDPPETVMEFIERWKAGSEIVWGKRRTRKDSLIRRIYSYVFLSFMKHWAIPKNSLFTTGSFLLIDRRVLECCRQFREHGRITFAIVAWTGFDQDVVLYDRQARTTGKSGWTFGQMIKTFYDAMIGFSYLPIRLATILGIIISILNVPFIAYVLISWCLGNTSTIGWTSIVLFISIFGGVQLLILGMVSEYLYRIHREAINRPLYFISKDTTNEHKRP